MVSGAIIALFLCFMLFSFATDWIWPEFNGSYHLGKNIYKKSEPSPISRKREIFPNKVEEDIIEEYRSR